LLATTALGAAAAHVDLERGAGRGRSAGHVGHADADAERGRHRPEVTSPPPDDRVALARDAAAGHDERDELLGGPGLAHARGRPRRR
jgi:hypothetical protein